MTIKDFRLSKNWTQKQLAEELSSISNLIDISVRTVQDWEQGRRHPDKILQKLLDKLMSEKTVNIDNHIHWPEGLDPFDNLYSAMRVIIRLGIDPQEIIDKVDNYIEKVCPPEIN